MKILKQNQTFRISQTRNNISLQCLIKKLQRNFLHQQRPLQKICRIRLQHQNCRINVLISIAITSKIKRSLQDPIIAYDFKCFIYWKGIFTKTGLLVSLLSLLLFSLLFTSQENNLFCIKRCLLHRQLSILILLKWNISRRKVIINFYLIYFICS